MEVTLIANPFASRVSEDRLAVVRRTLSERWRVTTLLTERRGHAIDLARAAQGDAVVVFSGDGVFNEVLNGLDRDVPVGFVPGGGTNVLPRALGLPREPVAAARQIVEGSTRRISLGRVNGRRFAFSAGLGFDAEVVRRIDARGRSDDGRRPGDAAFAWTLARVALARRLRWGTDLEIEGIGRAAIVFVSNGHVYSYLGARPLVLSPDARFELGLDFVAPGSIGPRRFMRYVAGLVSGRGVTRLPGVLVGHDLDRFRVRCDRPLPLQVDGEDLGDVTEADFEAERDAISVFVPKGL